MRLKPYQVDSSLEAFHPGGHAELLSIARSHRQPGVHDGMHSTSREDVSDGPLSLPVATVPPEVVDELAPWLQDWYRGPLLAKARDFAGPLVVVSEDPENFPLINFLHGWNPDINAGESYESHVDSNFPTGLYLLGERDRTPDTGGALVVSNRGDVPTRTDVLRDCGRYYPRVGELAIMDGYDITHFVGPSTDGADRITLVCNFWTPEAREFGRAAGLAEYQSGLTVEPVG